MSREAFDKVLGDTEFKVNPPGPGAYNVGPTFGTSSSKYTMRLRTALMGQNITARIVPGPGQYTVPVAISSNGRYSYAKFKSHGVTSFNPASSARFQKSSIGFYYANENNDNLGLPCPGPGNYNVPQTITRNGSYFVSRFKSSGNVPFTKARREGIIKEVPIRNNF